MTLKGWPETVISRGEIVVSDGTLRAEQGRGRFLKCDPPTPARPRGGAGPSSV
jgi:dihydropyrimidinase